MTALTLELAEVVSREIQPGWENAEAAARAVLSHLAGKGGITDEQIVAALNPSADDYINSQAQGPFHEWKDSRRIAAFRALLAQQAAVDAARIAELTDHLVSESLLVVAMKGERDAALARVAVVEAENARLRMYVGICTFHWDEGPEIAAPTFVVSCWCCQSLRAEVAEAQVARVRALVENPLDHIWSKGDELAVPIADLRAALDSEPSKATFTPGGNPTCSACGGWYLIGTAHECPAALDGEGQ